MLININDLSYRHPDGDMLFENVCLSITTGARAALVGNNGVGKSTLLRIIMGERVGVDGQISVTPQLWLVPQHFGQYDTMTIAGALGIQPRLAALDAILAGELTADNFDMLANDWDIAERALSALEHWGSTAELSRPMSQLSGGEKTKVFLAGIQIHSPDLIVMDEPSNHLDGASREMLYDLVESHPAAILSASHDRRLLRLMQVTCQLTPKGIKVYGGNYDFYEQQKEVERQAIEGDVAEKRKAVRSAHRTARLVAERQNRLEGRAPAKLKQEGLPRIMINSMRSHAQKSSAKIKGVHAEKIESFSRNLRSCDSSSRLIRCGSSCAAPLPITAELW